MGDRNELWKIAWETFYDASYYEILFGETSKNWQTFDFVARLLVAFTVSGSAVSGWALWNDEEYKIGWVIFAGAASVISIIHATLNTNDKLKHYAQLSADISDVKLEYETFRHELSIYPDFDVDQNFKKHQRLREKFQKVISSYTTDFLASKRVQNMAQNILNQKLGIQE